MYLGGRGHDVEVRGSSATGAYASGGASWPDPETRRDAYWRFFGYLHSTNWLRIFYVFLDRRCRYTTPPSIHQLKIMEKPTGTRAVHMKYVRHFQQIERRTCTN